MRLIITFLFLCTCLFGENYVDLFTGECLLRNEDLFIEGIEPISIQRTYVSSNRKEDLGGWAIAPDVCLVLHGEKKGKKEYVYEIVRLKEPDGTLFTYKKEENHFFRIQGSKIPFHLDRQTLQRIDNHTFILIKPDRTKRIYRKAYTIGRDVFFLLKREELPNGNWHLYHYDHLHRLLGIKTTNPSMETSYAWCRFDYAKESETSDFSIVSSDNQKVAYQFSKGKHWVLEQVTGAVEESYHYSQDKDGTLLDKRIGQNGDLVQIHYLSSGKVGKIEKGDRSSFSFSYSPNQTAVIDSHGQKTIYRFSKNGLLLEKAAFDADENPIGSHSYKYDLRGNIIEESFSGDLTGNGLWEVYSIQKSYDELNRVISIKEGNGKNRSITYFKTTNLPLITEIGDEDKTWLQISYKYNVDHLAIKTIASDGNGLEKEVANNWVPPQETPENFLTPQDQILAQNARDQVTQFSRDGSLYSVQYYLDGTLQSLKSETIQVQYFRDLFGRLLCKQTLSKEGALLKEEKWSYNLFHLLSKTDPEGVITEFDYDDLGRKSTERLLTEKGPSETLFFYDEKNRVEKIQLGDLITLYRYDLRNRIIEKKEVDPKGTLLSKCSFAYGENGAIKSVTTQMSEGSFTRAISLPALDEQVPSQPGVHRTYDPLGRLIELFTEDGTVHYSIEYNKRDQPTTLIDHVQGSEGNRIYDEQGNLVEETLLSGQTLTSTYDLYGRRIQLTLPDQSLIYYRWGPKYLQEIRRKTLKDQFEYSHLLSKYDLAGFPITQRLILGFGILSFTLDPSMQISSTSCRFLDLKNTPSMEEDSLSISVKKPSYTIIRDGLGRITEFHLSNKKIFYTYDVWDRRLTKTVLENTRGVWQETLSLAFLYDDQREIGAMDEEMHRLKQLRVCADQLINTGDQAIGYELDRLPYIPLYDVYGNPKELLSIVREKIMETYSFNPNGKETIRDIYQNSLLTSKAGNPWRYGCHRIDEETGLLYIDGDYYDPELGHFLDHPEKKFPEQTLLQLPGGSI